jgi:parvulin-like peptidyl-prolyl isomerase
VVATVGVVQITRGDVERMAAGMDRPGLSPSELQQEAIEELIAQELLFQEAQRRGIQVGEDDIAAQVDILWREFLSRGTYEQRKAEGGLDDAKVRQQVQRDLMIARLLDEEVYAKSIVDDDEVIIRPSEIHEFYIYRGIRPDAPQEERQETWEKMRQARETLLAGADFGETAKEHSQSGLAKHGGDAGWVTFDPTSRISAALFALQEGQISDIVESEHGLFILKAGEIRAERTQPFGELNPKLKRIVLQKMMAERLDWFIEELRRKADVELVS